MRDQDLSMDTGNGGSEFNHWYCNLFFLDRRKCLLWTHGMTLFSVLAPGVRQDDFRRFGELFRSQASAVLSATEGVAEGDIAWLLDDGPDRFAKTDNRSVLGSMNDHVFACKVHAAADGFERLDFIKLSRYLNEVPMGTLGYKNASECPKLLLDSETSLRNSFE